LAEPRSADLARVRRGPDAEAAIRKELNRLVNLAPKELEAWLDTAGDVRKGEGESVGRPSAKKILKTRTTQAADLGDADDRRMKKAIGCRRRQLAQRPWGDVTDTRWRWSLMNRGPDPLKAGRGS
jgi:ElaB/YqjD/DUF883 family membrane-anchored ribosome-binding protein